MLSKALNSGVTREDVYQSLAFATLGVNIGLYRDESKLLPIIARAPEDERTNLPGLSDRMVWSPAQQSHIPMSQVIDGFSLQPEDSLIFRRNRYRVVSALANPPRGENFTLVFESMRGDVEAIPLPTGYSLEWGGEYEGSQEARETLGTKIPITFGVMFFVTLLMFGKLRQPIVIWLTVPMTVCGVVISLLVTDLSFTFPSFLGFLSLSGMLIKNCVVLVDEIDKRVDEEGMSIESIAQASLSRLRPVMLAAGTTIVGHVAAAIRCFLPRNGCLHHGWFGICHLAHADRVTSVLPHCFFTSTEKCESACLKVCRKRSSVGADCFRSQGALTRIQPARLSF